MTERFKAARIYGQVFILPSIGILSRENTTFKPRLAIAWLCWGFSIGFGKEY